MKPLEGQIAVVTGATRGAGRGIALELAAAGATVYCTGRSIRGQTTGRPETIDETAEMINENGGRGIAVQVDHLVPAQVEALFERIAREQNGQLDLIVNDIWGGDELTEWGRPFWEHSLEKGLQLLDRAVNTHIITSHFGARLLVARKRGLIVEVTDSDSFFYRGTLFYDLAKIAVIRLAFSQAEELRPHGVSSVAVSPGFLRSEAVLDHFGVTAENWRDAIAKDPHFAASETPRFVGRAIAALQSDPRIAEKSGKLFASWTLAHEYGFHDIDGSQPDWGEHVRANLPDHYAALESTRQGWLNGPQHTG